MNDKKITRRIFFGMALLAISGTSNARGGHGGGHGGGRSWGRGGRSGGGSFFLGFLLVVGAIWWAGSAIFGRKKTGALPSRPPELKTPPGDESITLTQEQPNTADLNRLGLCPRCGKTMQLRTAKRGRYAGRAFLGCSGYPRCFGTRPASKLP